MSGGSFDYAFYKILDYQGHMRHQDLEELLKDFSDLLHDVEWAEDCDISWDDYEQSVIKFRKKWLKENK